MPAMQTQVISIILLALLLQQLASALVSDAPPASHPCSWQGRGYTCSINAAQINLSARGLSGHLTLTFTKGNSNLGSHQFHMDLLNMSANPNLTGITIEIVSNSVASVQINHLDISGTAMAPVPGRLLNIAASLLSIHTLTANGTAYETPLDLDKAADLLYRMRVQTFTLVGWPLVNGFLPANLTSHSANRCGSKRFKSLAVSRSRLLRSLTGGNGGSGAAIMAVPDNIDLSGNGFRSVSNITFSGARIDLSDNHLTNLREVAFRPGSVCRSVVTGPPTLLLARNRLLYAALDSLAAGGGQQSGFAGLDLSGNERLVPNEEDGVSENVRKASNVTIQVSEFLDLSGLSAHMSGLATLLARFRLLNEQKGVREAYVTTFRLSLADNCIPDLASAAALVSSFASTTRSGNGSGTPVHLDLSGNRHLVHLNLSSISPDLLASLTVKRLPQLHSASVRISDRAIAGVHERLRGRDQPPDVALLAELWSQQRVPLQMDAQPSQCCLANDAELVCSFHRSNRQSNRHKSTPASIFCSKEETHVEPLVSPELPLLFTCVILGCALLLGLMTGVAVFYARRRYNRGRYAVYSVYDVQVKDQLQSRGNSTNQLQQQHPPRSPGGQVQLKAITVCSTVLPIEKAATPV